MLYFNLTPDFQVLSKYYKLEQSAEVMIKTYPDGYPLLVNRFYSDEMVQALDKGFIEIIIRYKLEDHYYNLLFLSLLKVYETEAILDELYLQYDQKKRTKELANLLLVFNQSLVKDYDSIQLKTFKSKAKVGDKKTIEWIGSILIESVKKGAMPACDFEFGVINLFFDEIDGKKQINIEKLKVEATQTIQHPKKCRNEFNSDFCFYLYAYLINETNIKPDPKTITSDAQLKFYFDLLALFGYINPDKIDSEPKDYIGTILKNRIKTLNPHYQGNKRK